MDDPQNRLKSVLRRTATPTKTRWGGPVPVNAAGAFSLDETHIQGDVLNNLSLSGITLEEDSPTESGNNTDNTGHFSYPDGSTYTGELDAQGQRSGLGTYCYCSGQVFTGRFSKDNFEGEGYLEDTSTGHMAWGQWHLSKLHGMAIMLQGGTKYIGRFIQGRKEGQFTVLYASGAVYEGEYHDNVKHGLGRHTWPPCDSHSSNVCVTYSGSWSNGLPHGEGVMTFADQSMYQGMFRGGKAHGNGMYASRTEQYTYKGQFKAGKGRHGHGTLRTKRGDRYKGEWRHDMRHGYGVLSLASGVLFTGQWFEDQPSGDGILQTPGSKAMIGKWDGGVVTQKKFFTKTSSVEPFWHSKAYSTSPEYREAWGEEEKVEG